MIVDDPTRRNLFMMGGVGALAMAGMAQAAEPGAPAMDDTEKANVKLVGAFCPSFKKPRKAAAMLAEGAVVRISETKPAVIGPKGFLAFVQANMGPDDRAEIINHETFAKGPLVANYRTDIIKRPGKPDIVVKVAGVFIVKNGKIVEWSEYVVGQG